MQIRSSREGKLLIAKKLASRTWPNGHPVGLTIHQLSVSILCCAESQRSILETTLPKQWFEPENIGDPDVVVHWLDCRQFKIAGSLWSEDPDPNIKVFDYDQLEACIQRDFVGLFSAESPRHALIVTDTANNDGFFNAMRWLLPRFLLKKDQILLHAAGIVDGSHAYVFAGPSGSGKTTMAAKAEKRTVLGDDMIVLSKEKSRLSAEAGFFGQNIRYWGPVGTRFPLAAIIFLYQGDEFQIGKTARPTAARLLLRDWNLCGWERMAGQDWLIALHLADAFVSTVACFSVTATLNTSFEEITHGLECQPKRGARAPWQTMDGEVLVITPDSGTVHELNSSAAWIWQQLDGQKTVSSIIEDLQQIYDVEPDRALDDVTRIIGELHIKGMLADA